MAQSLEISKELWYSYDLGFYGARAGLNKTLEISKDNPYFKVGTTMTIKVLLSIVERIARMKIGTFVNSAGYNELKKDEYGFQLYWAKIMNELKDSLVRKKCIPMLSQSDYDNLRSKVKDYVKVPLWSQW